MQIELPAAPRAFDGAFHHYVRSMLALQSDRERRLSTTRTRWLQRLAQRPASSAERRWESEGGSTREARN